MGKLEKGTYTIYGGKRGGKRNEGHYNEVLLYKVAALVLQGLSWSRSYGVGFIIILT